MTKPILVPDFCIVGAGSGGLSFAAGAVQMGASVVLVERRKMGGDCLNYGCIPSKSLLAAAKIGHVLRESSTFGWTVSGSHVDFKQVHAYIQSIIQNIAPHDSVERFQSLGAQVILEEGRFIAPDTLETESYLIKAKRFILATGSTPFIPPISGLSDVPYLTNETIFDLKELPQHLVVIGGGPIGIEMAQAFVRFGSKVTVLEAFAALPKDDPDMTFTLKEILRDEGMEINEHVHILSVASVDQDIELLYKNDQCKEKKIIASHLLVAAGRRPALAPLNLDAAQVPFSSKGITVDQYLRTSNPKIYALGDCTGGYQFTHVAGYHAGLVIRNSIFKLRSSVQTQAIPWVTYTDPELAHVGFLESQLKEQGRSYKVLAMDFEENDRAQAEHRTDGKIKILLSPKGEVLGATILGSHAGELIYPWVMVIQNKLTISAIANSIAPYPTLSDINKRVAGTYYTDKIFSPFMKKVVTFLMRITR